MPTWSLQQEIDAAIDAGVAARRSEALLAHILANMAKGLEMAKVTPESRERDPLTPETTGISHQPTPR